MDTVILKPEDFERDGNVWKLKSPGKCTAVLAYSEYCSFSRDVYDKWCDLAGKLEDITIATANISDLVVKGRALTTLGVYPFVCGTPTVMFFGSDVKWSDAHGSEDIIGLIECMTCHDDISSVI